jgi:hypothetical protein
MYDPSVGRWLEKDPVGFAAGDANLYRYAGNDPVNRADPSGEAPVLPGGGYSGNPITDLIGKVDFSPTKKLTGLPITIGGVKADISVGLGTMAVPEPDADTSFIQFSVRLQRRTPAAVAAMKDVHWLQFVKRTRKLAPGVIAAVNPPYKARVLVPDPRFILPVLLPGAAFRDLPGLFGPLGAGFLAQKQMLVNRFLDIEYLDAGTTTFPFYGDSPGSGRYYRTPTSLTIYDGPTAILPLGIGEEQLTANTYLVISGKVAYRIEWTRTWTLDARLNRISVKYNVVQGIRVVAEARTKDKVPSLVIGIDPITGKKVVAPNPITGVYPQ